LTEPARKFFKEEFRKDDQEASLRKLEFLIMDVVQPYKIGLLFFVATAALIGTVAGYQWWAMQGVQEDLRKSRDENSKLKLDLDASVAKLIAIQAEPKKATDSTAGLGNMLSENPDAFFRELIAKAQAQKIPKAELVRLIKDAGNTLAEFTVMQLKQNPVLRNALTTAEFEELETKANKK